MERRREGKEDVTDGGKILQRQSSRRSSAVVESGSPTQSEGQADVDVYVALSSPSNAPTPPLFGVLSLSCWILSTSSLSLSCWILSTSPLSLAGF